MKKIGSLMAIAVLLSLGSFVHADGNQANEKKETKQDPAVSLMKTTDCLVCHTVDKKLVGPAFKDIAKKYKDDKKAAEVLVKKVKKGGSGNWGEIPMAPHATLKDKDIKIMVDWVLSQGQKKKTDKKSKKKSTKASSKKAASK